MRLRGHRLFVSMHIAAACLASLGCARNAAQSPRSEHRADALGGESDALAPLALPGVEIEVMAARLAGRGDSSLEFLIGRAGRVEKRCSIRSWATSGFRPGLVAPPSTRSDATLAVELGEDGSDNRVDDRPLTEEDSEALRRALQVAIIVASTPEVFEPPAEFLEDPTWGRTPWRRLNPPVRLRVDRTWLEKLEESRFDGTWLIIASPPPPEPERVVLHVVGWRFGPQRSRPLQVLLSRGYIPERQVDVQSHQGLQAQELIKAVRAHASEEVLLDVEEHPSEPLWTWFAMARPLHIEVDGAWLRDPRPSSSELQVGPPGGPNFGLWMILADDQRP